MHGPAADSDERDDGDDGEDAPRAAGARAYITRDGLVRLRAEFDHLRAVERPRVTAEVAHAASLGDRSENAEYIYGKRRLREIDRRLRYLAARLEAVTVVERPPDASGRVFFGARVTLENQDDGTLATYHLVGRDEVDLRAGRISVESPVGKALLGRAPGDIVVVRRPRGETEFAVVQVTYP